MQVTGAFGPLGRKGPRAVEGGRVEVERIARTGLGGAAHHEGERGRAYVARDETQIDAVFGQRTGKRLAVAIGRNARDERRLRAEPRKPDRDIVGRAAERYVVGVRLDRIGDEIDQRFPGDKDHVFPPGIARGFQAIV